MMPEIVTEQQSLLTAPAVSEPSRWTDRSAATGWILAPLPDLLLISNLFWPLLLLLQHDDGFSGRAAVQFWQLYFITTPHRWVTLGLVFLDGARLRQNTLLFAGIAVVTVGVCLGVRIVTGGLTCLLLMDYLWNAWHFSAQHHGIYRIYGRLAGGRSFGAGTAFAEKWLMRGFLLYVIYRVAQVSVIPTGPGNWAGVADAVVIFVPVWLLACDFSRWPQVSASRIVYLLSVSGLYVSLLWAVRSGRADLVLSLATASAWFHASEYLAVVAWHLRKRGAGQDTGAVMRWLATRWIAALLIFAVILGACGWFLEHAFLEVWLLLNVIAAFLHYAYDGLIWKGSRNRSLDAVPHNPATSGSSGS